MSRQYLTSSSFKLSLLFFIILSISLTILASIGYILKQVNFEHESQASINAKIDSVKEIYDISGIDAVQKLLHKYNSYDYNYFYFLRDNNNNKVAGNLASLPDNVKLYDENFVMFNLDMDIIDKGQKLHKVHRKDSTIMAIILPLDEYDLIIGRNIQHIEYIKTIVNNFLWVIAALLMLIVFISFFVSDYVVRKINIIAKTAEKIMNTGDLSQRIVINTRWDDLSDLAILLNEMLDDIENLLEGVKNVSDNIAHDLRIPLTRLRNHIENLNYQQIANSEEIFSETKESLITEADHLLKTFAALLKISYLETRKSKANYVNIDLKELLLDAIELYQPVAEAKDITIKYDLADLNGRVDRDLLFQALINLIDNAIKYTGEKGEICIFMRKNSDGTNLIEICDNGIGIADFDKAKVFKRFYRVDKSRGTKGSGLGLSMVQAVIKAHKGKIELKDNKPGLIVSITI